MWKFCTKQLIVTHILSDTKLFGLRKYKIIQPSKTRFPTSKLNKFEIRTKQVMIPISPFVRRSWSICLRSSGFSSSSTYVKSLINCSKSSNFNWKLPWVYGRELFALWLCCWFISMQRRYFPSSSFSILP